jgi:SOS-response transcriptional repressor LexA
MNTVQDRQMKDVQHHHMYNKLCFSNAIVEDMMFAIAAVVEDENHFVVEIVLNQIDDTVSDGDVIVVDDAAVIGDDVVVVADADDERMAVVLEMDDDFVHFVLVVYSFHSIVLSNDH